MKLLYKDQFKKIKYNLFNFISLSFLVIVISLTFTVTKQSITRLGSGYDVYLETQQVEDFQFSMASADINYLGGTALMYICEELDIEYECYYNISIDTKASYNTLNHLINLKINENPEIVEGVIDDYISELENDYDLQIEKKNFSDIVDGTKQYRFATLTYDVDIPYLVEGVLPVEDFEIALFPEFAELNNISINDTITIKDQNYKVTAFVYSPDYVFPIYYLNPMDLNNETLVLTNMYTIEQLNNHIDRKYVATGSLSDILDAKDVEDIIDSGDSSVIGKNTQIKSVKPSESNFAISTLEIEVDNANIFIDAFLSLFIVFISLLLTIFLKRYIAKNKKDIETLRSLGYSDLELTKSLMVFPLIVSLMTLIGFGLGVILSNSIFDLYSARYLIPKAEFSLYYIVIQNAIILPIIFINLISFIFIRLSLQKDKKLSPKVKLKLFKYTPVKTMISSFVLMLIISIMIIFGMNGSSIFNSFGPYTKEGNNYYELLHLDYYDDTPLDEDYESFTKVGGKITHLNNEKLDKSKGVRVYGLDPTNDLKLLIDNDVSNNLLLEDGIIISEYTRYKTGVELGDEIVLRITDVDLSYTVVGISNELIENAVYIKKAIVNDIYNLDNTFYNGVYTTNNEYESTMISKRVNYQEGVESVIETLRASMFLVNFLLALSVVLSLFVFTLVLSNYLSDNRLNIAILKSIGYNNLEINKKYLLNIYLTFIVSYVIAIPLTSFLFDLLIRTIIDSIGYVMIINVSSIHIVIGFIILNIVFVVTTYLVTKYYDKVSISEILKYNIK